MKCCGEHLSQHVGYCIGGREVTEEAWGLPMQNPWVDYLTGGFEDGINFNALLRGGFRELSSQESRLYIRTYERSGVIVEVCDKFSDFGSACCEGGEVVELVRHDMDIVPINLQMECSL